MPASLRFTLVLSALISLLLPTYSMAGSVDGSRTGMMLAYQSKQVKVPKVIGMLYGSACGNLRSKGLGCSRHDVTTDKRSQKDKVQSQHPAARTSVSSGSTVSLGVYKYVKPAQKPAEELVRVPYVTGKYYRTACSTLLKAGLRCDISRVQGRSSSQRDKVRSQKPSSGQKVQKNSFVTIHVYK